MKRNTVILLAGILGLTLLAGCGNQEGSTSSSSSASSTAVSSASSAGAGEAQQQETDTPASETQSTASASKTEYITGDFTYEECMDVPEYKGLELSIEKVEIDDDYIEDYINAMMQAVKMEDPEATVQNKDTTVIDYAGTINGEAFDGGTAEGAELIIGSGSFIPGFEDGLVGMKVGEERDLELSFPQDYWNTELAGLPVVFHVKLNEIRRYPEITDEKIAELTDGEYTKADDYRDYIRDMATESKAAEIRETLKKNAWKIVYNGTTFKKLPQEYVQAGSDRYEEIITQEVAYYGAEDLEEYVTAAGMTMEEYERQKTLYGEEVAKARLLSEAIWEKEGCSRDDEAYAKYQETLASGYGYDVESFKEAFGEESLDQYCINMMALDILVDNAKITYL